MEVAPLIITAADAGDNRNYLASPHTPAARTWVGAGRTRGTNGASERARARGPSPSPSPCAAYGWSSCPLHRAIPARSATLDRGRAPRPRRGPAAEPSDARRSPAPQPTGADARTAAAAPSASERGSSGAPPTSGDGSNTPSRHCRDRTVRRHPGPGRCDARGGHRSKRRQGAARPCTYGRRERLREPRGCASGRCCRSEMP